MKQQLCRRLTEEFDLRGTPLSTRKTYTYCIGRFERHFDSSAPGSVACTRGVTCYTWSSTSS